MLTCCVMPAATNSPTMATIREQSRPTSGIAIFKTRRGIPLWHQSGSKNSLKIKSLTRSFHVLHFCSTRSARWPARTVGIFTMSRNSCRRSAVFGSEREEKMDNTTLLIVIIVLIVLLGGGGWYGRGRWF